MWRLGNNVDHVFFLSRVPTMLLSLFLSVFVYRWAYELFGRSAGLLALFLCALDPNLIAHSRLAATDLGSTVLILIACYWTWRLFLQPTWSGVLWAGISLGLAQSSRFSALALGPSFALLYVWRAFVGKGFAIWFPGMDRYFESRSGYYRWWERLLWLVVVAGLVVVIGFVVIWAVHGFGFGSVPGLFPFPVPAPAFWDEFKHIWGRIQAEEGREVIAFLMGDLYVGGRWDYFPVAFMLKTPLPTLILLVCGLIVFPWREQKRWLSVLWLPPAVFFGVSMFSKINLGYRYILPVVPFVLVICGRAGQWIADKFAQVQGSRRTVLSVVSVVLVVCIAWSGLAIYPHYLAYFNELAGGPDNGWRYLVDSNNDWGQDLTGLKRWMDEQGVERIKLGYVGEAQPPYYGINFEPLASSPDRWEHPMYHDLYPADPQPGLYAISANLIQGRNLGDPETYAWFRGRDPIEKIGYSIFIYDVPHHGQGKVTVILSGLIPADILLEDYARFGTNDVRFLWSDLDRSIVYPREGERVFWLVTGDTVPHPAISHPPEWKALEPTTTRNGRMLRWFEGTGGGLSDHTSALAVDASVWHLTAAHFAPGDPQNHGERLEYPVHFGDSLDLLAYEMDASSLTAGETLTLVTYWQVRAPAEAPQRLFVHLLDADSTYMGGEDRFDVWFDNWLPGDQFVQVQQVRLEAGVAEGEIQVEIGWYDPETMQRLPVIRDDTVIADRVLLQPIKAR